MQSKLFIVIACVLGISMVFSGCGNSKVSAAHGAAIVDGNFNIVSPVAPGRGRRSSYGHSPTRRGWLDTKARRASLPTSFRDFWHEQYKYLCALHIRVRRAASVDVLGRCERDLTAAALAEADADMCDFHKVCIEAFVHAKTLGGFEMRKAYLTTYLKEQMDKRQAATELRSRAFLDEWLVELRASAVGAN